jgi:hypothetical protein
MKKIVVVGASRDSVLCTHLLMLFLIGSEAFQQPRNSLIFNPEGMRFW